MMMICGVCLSVASEKHRACKIARVNKKEIKIETSVAKLLKLKNKN